MENVEMIDHLEYVEDEITGETEIWRDARNGDLYEVDIHVVRYWGTMRKVTNDAE